MARDAIQSRVEGVEAARAALEAIIRAERGVIPEQLAVIGQQAVTENQRRAPLRTGRLRRSYTYEVDSRGRWVEISTNVEYAPYQEYGTVHQPGTPHVRPGIEAVIPKMPGLLAEGMSRAGLAAGGRFGGGASGVLRRTIGRIKRG